MIDGIANWRSYIRGENEIFPIDIHLHKFARENL
jgi:hypothetical protein